MDEYNEFGEKAGAAGVIGGGEALHPPSTAVGVEGGRQGRRAHPHRCPLRRGQGGHRRVLPARLRPTSTRPIALGGADPGAGMAGSWFSRASTSAPRAERPRPRGCVPVPRRATPSPPSPASSAASIAAEEAVQDAFVVALERWPIDGVPDQPGPWITTIARNKALDRLRREAKRIDKQCAAHRSLASFDGGTSRRDSVVRDDVLALVFMCCYPELSIEARVRARPGGRCAGCRRRPWRGCSSSGGDDGPTPRARQAPARPTPGTPLRCPPPTSCRNGCRPCWPRCTCCSPKAATPPAGPTTSAPSVATEAGRASARLSPS